MKELKLKKPIDITLKQFECFACDKKIYVNKEDIDGNVLDCPFCNVHNIKNIRSFEVVINKIIEN